MYEPCVIRHEPCVIIHEPCVIRHKTCIVMYEPCVIRHEHCVIRHEPCVIRYEPCVIGTRPTQYNRNYNITDVRTDEVRVCLGTHSGGSRNEVMYDCELRSSALLAA